MQPPNSQSNIHKIAAQPDLRLRSATDLVVPPTHDETDGPKQQSESSANEDFFPVNLTDVETFLVTDVK
jgi:hypothetical protein